VSGELPTLVGSSGWLAVITTASERAAQFVDAAKANCGPALSKVKTMRHNRFSRPSVTQVGFNGPAGNKPD